MSNIISFFQKLIKGGVGIRVGGLENFSKINKWGDDYSILESIYDSVEISVPVLLSLLTLMYCIIIHR